LADPELHDATLREKADAGGGLVRLILTPSRRVAGTYHRPGQYVVASAGGKRAYLVLAGDPGADAWELLVRPGGDAVTAILAVSPGGEPLRVSGALGAGFPMEEAAGNELIVLVTGSGLAAGRPVLRARSRSGEATSTELLLGVRTRGDVPLGADLAAWASAGARVTVCLSRQGPQEAPAGPVVYAAGYVQDVARSHARRAPRAKRLIFAAGVKPMIEAARELARDLGVHESDVRTNY
jgi:NAD(P)H-flavin reductase